VFSDRRTARVRARAPPSTSPHRATPSSGQKGSSDLGLPGTRCNLASLLLPGVEFGAGMRLVPYFFAGLWCWDIDEEDKHEGVLGLGGVSPIE
jgi:hypothetical protein